MSLFLLCYSTIECYHREWDATVVKTITDGIKGFTLIVLQVKGSVVYNNGRLKPGDQIIGLNGKDLLTATREQIAHLLKVYKATVRLSVLHISYLLLM